MKGTSRPRAAVFVFVSVLVSWLLWSGHFSLDHGLLMFLGVLSAALVTALCWRMDLLDDEAMPLHVLGRGAFYLPWLSWQVLLSCIDVLRRGLGPRFDLDPQIVRVKGSQETDLGLVIYANSLTLTPGTVSMDTDANEITAHAISPTAADALETGAMDRWVSWVEGR